MGPEILHIEQVLSHAHGIGQWTRYQWQEQKVDVTQAPQRSLMVCLNCMMMCKVYVCVCVHAVCFQKKETIKVLSHFQDPSDLPL